MADNIMAMLDRHIHKTAEQFRLMGGITKQMREATAALSILNLTDKEQAKLAAMLQALTALETGLNMGKRALEMVEPG